MVKKIMYTATKTGTDAGKTVSKRVLQKTAEATGEFTGNKIAEKVTSLGKPKKTNKESRRNLHSARKKTTDNWWLKIVLV